MKEQKSFLPALSYRFLTPLYDPLVALTVRESAFKRRLVAQARIASGHKVLDVGCGTATLTVRIKQAHPDTEVIGIDADPDVLQRARKKIARSSVNITLDQGMSYQLPYPDGTFERVLSSLLFHHLTRKNKIETFKEIHRVLRDGGELHFADWGKPKNLAMHGAFLLVQVLDGFETTTDNRKGLLLSFMNDAGFEEVQETVNFTTMFGTLSLYKARKGSH